MHCGGKRKGSAQQPACQVVWHVIQDRVALQQVDADWDWFLSRFLMPTRPKTIEAPVSPIGASQNCEPDIANQRRDSGTASEESTNDTPADHATSSSAQ
jgi:hypothetical protein